MAFLSTIEFLLMALMLTHRKIEALSLLVQGKDFSFFFFFKWKSNTLTLKAFEACLAGASVFVEQWRGQLHSLIGEEQSLVGQHVGETSLRVKATKDVSYKNGNRLAYVLS